MLHEQSQLLLQFKMTENMQYHILRIQELAHKPMPHHLYSGDQDLHKNTLMSNVVTIFRTETVSSQILP